MPPEQTNAPVNDGTSVPDEGAPGSGTSTFDFERGYSELRPAYTQATQRLSEYEGLFQALHDPDPEVQSAAMEALGLEPAGETGGSQLDDDEFPDPLEQELAELRATVEEIRQRDELEAESASQAQTLEMRDNYIGEAISYIEQETKRKFTDQEDEILGNLAIAMEDEDGVPDVQGAYNRLYGADGFLETQRSQWIETKRGARPAPLGSTIPADQKPRTAAERTQFMDQRLRELEDQQ